ncbi:MAG: sulfotransferase [Pseudomonadota bacterium]
MQKLNLQDAPKMFEAALAEQKRGNVTEALKIYVQIVDAFPHIPEPYYQVGVIEMERYHYTGAAAHFEKALGIRPNELGIWRQFARALRLLNDKKHTRNALENLERTNLPAPDKSLIKKMLTDRTPPPKAPIGGASREDIRHLTNLLEAQNTKELVSVARNVTRRHPDSAVAHNLLACGLIETGQYEEAERALTRAIQKYPKYIDALLNLTRVYIETGRRDKAMLPLEKAKIIAPDSLQAALHLATIFESAGNLQEAIRALEPVVPITLTGKPPAMKKMSELLSSAGEHDLAIQYAKALFKAKKDPISFITLGSALDKADQLEEAEAVYREGLKKFPSAAMLYGRLGSLLQVKGNFEEGRSTLEKAIELSPDNGGLYTSYLQSVKLDVDDPFFKKMLEKFEREDLDPSSRIAFGYAISSAFEKAKEFDKVFYYLNSANKEQRRSYPYNINSRYQDLEKTKEFYEEYGKDKFNGDGVEDFKPIFITGMPRSGTTLTERIISAHSTVVAGGEDGQSRAVINKVRTFPGEQLRRFDTMRPETVNRIGQLTKEHFQERFPGATIVTDKAIGTYAEMGLIKAALPNAKFVLLRRDPRDNLLSIYKNRFADGTHGYANDLEDLAKYYHVYLDFIDFWREKMPGQFYELNYEKLTDNPEEETRKLIEYCELEWEDACLSFHEQESTVRTLSIYQARQPIYKSSVALWENYKDELKPMLDILETRGE